MSLQDQLLKAGLVSKEKAKKIKSKKNAQKHRSHRDKKLKEKLSLEKQQHLEEIKALDEAKKAFDRERNQARLLKEAQKEARLQARQLIDSHRVNIWLREEEISSKKLQEGRPQKQENTIRFNFSPDGKKVRFVMVNAAQQNALLKGDLAICRNDRDGFDYPLLPKAIAQRLLALEEKYQERWLYYFITDPEDKTLAEINDEIALEEQAAWEAYEASLKAEDS